ncbi:MAG: hypothetical protein ACC662_10310 [Planctomycetota bacterium]
MKSRFLSRLIDVLCGFVAYVGARLIWSTQDVFANLPWELLTFALIYLLLQAIIRGWRLARAGRAP